MARNLFGIGPGGGVLVLLDVSEDGGIILLDCAEDINDLCVQGLALDLSHITHICTLSRPFGAVIRGGDGLVHFLLASD